MSFGLSVRLVVTAAIAGVLAAPAHPIDTLRPRQVCANPPIQGPSNAYYYYWTDNPGWSAFTNLGGGKYSLQWSTNGGSVIAGKGWKPGTNTRVINYTGTYQPSGNSMVSVYGWTHNPLIEYRIVESYGSLNPGSAYQRMGSVTCNGANYDIYRGMSVNHPSVDCVVENFTQFWSIRSPKKFPGTMNGTIDTACHYKAWASVGLNLGATHDFQILATEAYYSSGNATFTLA